MAWVSQEKKSKIAPVVKSILKKYGVRGTLAVSNHSTLVLNIKSGKIDFIGNYNKTCDPRYLARDNIDVNTYWWHDHFSGTAKKFFSEIIPALKGPDFYDNSDIQTDYFDVSHYIGVNIGRWNKPYILETNE